MNDGLILKPGNGLMVIKKTMPETAYNDKPHERKIVYLDSKEAI